MIPKKASKIYKIVSEDLNIHEKLVEDLVQFYYKELRSKMSSLSHTRINVEGLGHVMVKPKIVEQAILRLEKSVKNHDTSTYNAYHNITIKINEDLEERKKIKSYNYENNTENNLGEQD